MDAQEPDNLGVAILVVEDSLTQAEHLKHALEQHGFVVALARNGREALASIKECRPDIVISDIIMPEMDGYQLCREIQQDSGIGDLPVMLLTALSDPRDVLKGLECGADSFISKPYEESCILARIQYTLANRHLKGGKPTEPGVDVILGNERYVINAGRMQILNLLLSSYEAAIQKNCELIRAQDELRVLNQQLEQNVLARTAALLDEIKVRKRFEEEFRMLNDELELRVKERTAELERLNSLFVDRELRMVELKEKIRSLENKPAQ